MGDVSPTIEGLSGGHCVRSVGPASLPGVQVDKVTFASSVVTYVAAGAKLEQTEQAVPEEEYEVRSMRRPS